MNQALSTLLLEEKVLATLPWGLIRNFFEYLMSSGEQYQFIFSNTDIMSSGDIAASGMMEFRFGSADNGTHRQGLLLTVPE
ncbi:hypothetical protein AL08_08840 [Corynebacterium diphtheriae bv. gravis str. ISS 4746]|nr:hypothetical protein AL08_08840 [Corynebacterium diphtheriae bv. gravis str. ISS 4746]KLN43781.1 hypothetical protein AL09_08885 [Corynebacterium diphtheriae bv. gravis str. ISS 4749]OWN53359.1 hypothetical protein AY512_05970 [Corynebacterium diphtheriae bv. gravis]